MRHLCKVAAIAAAFTLFTNYFSALPVKAQSAEEDSRSSNWGPYRGFNATPLSTNQELQAAANYGANMVRISFGVKPIINKTPPYNINPSAIADLDRIINTCEDLGLKVVIDPHTTPGTADRYTTSPTDPFWHNVAWHQYLINLWYYLANRYKDRGPVIAGYDLLNEPAFASSNPKSDAADWNGLVAKLVRTIRSTGDRHWIIIETQVGFVGGHYVNRLEGINYLRLPSDNKLVVSPHMYMPQKFTLQGTGGNPIGPKYPGTINGTYYDRNQLNEEMQPVLTFQRSHPHVPIWFGEFSATLYGGRGSDTWVNDVITVMENHHWNWAYHDFRQTPWFDPEIPSGNPLHTGPRSGNTPRMQTLKYFFKRNP